MIRHLPIVFGRALFAALVLPLLISTPLRAEGIARQITVSGEGQVAAVPDMATITIGVTQQSKTARSALDATLMATIKIQQRLADFGVAPRDMQTSSLALNAIRANRSASKTTVSGFSARNLIFVRLRDLDSIGQILDAVIDDGANNFNGLQFSVQNPEPLIAQARRQAVADATAKATLLTKAANVSLGAVLSMTENGGGRVQMMERSAARGGGVPIAAGEVSVSASVTMVFAIETLP